MRGVAQPLELVVIGRALRLLAGNQILDRDEAVAAAYARHLRDHVARFGKMMHREAAHDHVEFLVVERQPRLDVALAETDVGDSTLGAHLLRDLERRVGQIDSHDFAAHRRKRHRDMPRSRRDFQHARVGRRRDQLDQLAQMFGVANRRRRRVVIGLPGEFLANEILMLHATLLSYSRRTNQPPRAACALESLNGTSSMDSSGPSPQDSYRQNGGTLSWISDFLKNKRCFGTRPSAFWPTTARPNSSAR